LSASSRALLIEHVDAIGAAPDDARLHAAALSDAGFAVETIVLDAMSGDDLQYPAHRHRSRSGDEVLGADAEGLAALELHVRERQPALVVWAGAAPGGGTLARHLPRDVDALWWPTGHAPVNGHAGPLAPLGAELAPCEGSAHEPVRSQRPRLSLWDGPFALVPAPPGPEAATLLLEAFAHASSGRDEIDLVVLDHARPHVEAAARRLDIALRVHFVGRPPREAELAWLTTATVALVSGDAPISGGMLLRALGCGCPLLAVGGSAAPIGAWLEAGGCTWAQPASAAALATAIEAALDREDAVERARTRGRALSAASGAAALATRLRAALARAERPGRRAA